jgi:hypothetical protein
VYISPTGKYSGTGNGTVTDAVDNGRKRARIARGQRTDRRRGPPFADAGCPCRGRKRRLRLTGFHPVAAGCSFIRGIGDGQAEHRNAAAVRAMYGEGCMTRHCMAGLLRGRATPPQCEGSNMLLPALPAKDDAGLRREGMKKRERRETEQLPRCGNCFRSFALCAKLQAQTASRI